MVVERTDGGTLRIAKQSSGRVLRGNRDAGGFVNREREKRRKFEELQRGLAPAIGAKSKLAPAVGLRKTLEKRKITPRGSVVEHIHLSNVVEPKAKRPRFVGAIGSI